MSGTSTRMTLFREDVTVDGPRTRRWVLSAGECRALEVHRIARLGIDHAHAPYERVRLSPEGSFLMLVLEGEGRVLLEGRWQTLAAGWAAMAPPRVMNAFHAIPGKAWRFAWVRYDEPGFVSPMVNAGSPLRVKTVSLPGRAWEGLREEMSGEADARCIHHWVELIQLHARRLTEPWRKEQRLRKVWAEVELRLNEDWSIGSLARLAHVSEEHLRRLCWRELGRSPVAHLTFMRMQVARHLLSTSRDKLDFIARQVGYSTAEAFSRTFNRWSGCTPGEFRFGSSHAAGGF